MLKSRLYIILVAMLPILELRGALPLAYTIGIPQKEAIILALIGNCLPIPFIYKFGEKLLQFFIRKNILKNTALRILEKAQKKADEIAKKNSWQVFLALAAFVAVPLPGSGVYSGLLVASFLKLSFWQSTLAALLGVLLAALFVHFSLFFFFS